MDLNELRIGNYLQFLSGDTFKVKAHDFRVLLDTPKHLWPKPIPITPEWLLKFGFKYQKDLKQYYLHNYGLEKTTNNRFEFWYGAYELTIIEYVHELQNLYFDLTKSELVI